MGQSTVGSGLECCIHFRRGVDFLTGTCLEYLSPHLIPCQCILHFPIRNHTYIKCLWLLHLNPCLDDILSPWDYSKCVLRKHKCTFVICIFEFISWLFPSPWWWGGILGIVHYKKIVSVVYFRFIFLKYVRGEKSSNNFFTYLMVQ